jgi:hypothetical protein
LRALRAKVDELENYAALTAYEELTSTLDWSASYFHSVYCDTEDFSPNY